MNNKAVISLFLVCALTVPFLCACENNKEPVTVSLETVAPTHSPTAASPNAEVNSSPEAISEQATDDLRNLALQFVDKPIADLVEAIGEPLEKDYASSCLGPGEDGELIYEGFTVYTYKEGDSEVVKEVV